MGGQTRSARRHHGVVTDVRKERTGNGGTREVIVVATALGELQIATWDVGGTQRSMDPSGARVVVTVEFDGASDAG